VSVVPVIREQSSWGPHRCPGENITYRGVLHSHLTDISPRGEPAAVITGALATGPRLHRLRRRRIEFGPGAGTFHAELLVSRPFSGFTGLWRAQRDLLLTAIVV